MDGAAVVGCDHELNRVVFGEGDESCVVNHEEVVSAVLEWFAVEVAVDVVFCFGPAGWVEVVYAEGETCRLIGVTDGVESRLCFGFGWGSEREDCCWEKYQPSKAVIRAHPQQVVM